MNDYLKVLRANILAEFGRQEISRAQAAGWVNISPASFGTRLNGTTDFRIGELITLAIKLQVPFSTIVEGLDDVVLEAIKSEES